ncbi:MAG: lipoprotein [Pseudorhodoferax sp.]
MRRPPARLLAAGLLLVLAGCAGAPPSDPAEEPVAAPSPGQQEQAVGRFEGLQRVRALQLEDEGQWAEAAWTWEVLVALRPAHAPYRERASALRQRIAAAVAEQLERAEAAQRRGAPDQAATHYLRALALQPDHAQAADALRALERERNRRIYLGKPSRLTIQRRDGLEAAPLRPRPAAKPATGSQADAP